MTKTLIDIPDQLLADAMAVLGVSTKADAVRTALELVTERQRHLASLAWFVDHDPVADLRDPEVRASARR